MTDENDIPTVAYVLVILLPGPSHADAEQHASAHVAFIDDMTAAGAVLLGGSFDETLDSAEGAYLLRVGSAEEAGRWAAKDPLISSGAYRPRIIPWRLVGISRRAIAQEIASD
jgi:uncharacterized protein YciI